MSATPVSAAPSEPSPTSLRRLAWFRYEMRRFLKFSESAARAAGVTPKQHQLLLGVAGFTGRGWATVGELAEFLQSRHNAVVTLVQRGVAAGLLRKDAGPGDRRFARVRVTQRGAAILRSLASAHLQEIRRIGSQIRSIGRVRPRVLRHERP